MTGTVDEGVERFLGIPFAAPPVGDRRFLPPRPHGGWSAPLDAFAFGAAAPQDSLAVWREEDLVSDEDCLTLNVWRPASDDTTRPLVMLVHGGACASGSSRQSVYDGAAFARRANAVVVSCNYRLGILGWTDLEPLGGPPEGANLGLLDLKQAVAWVLDNLEELGADPDRLTMWGHSAGATCVLALLADPAVAGRFSAAMLQSGSARSIRTAETARAVTGLITDALHVGSFDELRSLPTERLLAAQRQVIKATDDGAVARPRLGFFHPFGPTVTPGAMPLPDPVDECPTPALLTGSTRDEWPLLPAHLRDLPRFLPGVIALLDRAGLPGRELVEAYRRHLPGHAPLLFRRIQTDRFFRVPLLEAAGRHVGRHPGGTFVYRFDWRSGGPHRVAMHGLDLAFATGNADEPYRSYHRAPADLQALWSGVLGAFAATGRPYGGPVEWPAFDDRSVYSVDTPPGILDDPDGPVWAIWQELAEAVGPPV